MTTTDKIKRMSKDDVFFYGADESLTSEELLTLVSELETKTRALESEPMIYECKFYGGVTVKIIAYDDASVIAFLDGRGYIDGVGSLVGNGLGYIAPFAQAALEGKE